ncbi:hypothetical protein T484DRAFT_1765209 [Baffinella frigidus]|nr:hypothetical protein T484DRAFT_1765209 [Cryptophyta sp. CCMP2293]
MALQCYIKRVRSGFQKLWPYYTLYVQDPDKFLLAGSVRRVAEAQAGSAWQT